MKKIARLLTVITLTGLFISCKKEGGTKVNVIQDCTGTYLRFEGKDYQVCNVSKVSSFKDGQEVMATFKKVNSCDRAKNLIVCQMLHENEGWIEVEKIK